MGNQKGGLKIFVRFGLGKGIMRGSVSKEEVDRHWILPGFQWILETLSGRLSKDIGWLRYFSSSINFKTKIGMNKGVAKSITALFYLFSFYMFNSKSSISACGKTTWHNSILPMLAGTCVYPENLIIRKYTMVTYAIFPSICSYYRS